MGLRLCTRTSYRFVIKCNCETTTCYIFLGSLEAIVNLTAKLISSTIHLSWLPPFSLNLTTAEPDIVYCVDVFNTTDGETEILRDHLISNCSVFEPYYNYAIDNPGDLLQFIVTPRSNIEGARNGTSKEINATSMYLIESKYSILHCTF